MTIDRCVDFATTHTLDDVGVVGDGLQGDVLDPLVDEPVPDVVARLTVGQRRASDLTFLEPPFGRIGQEVVRKLGAHESLPGQGECDPRRIDSDPAAAPLLGDVGCGA